MGTPLLAAAIVGGASGFTSGAVDTWLNGGSFLQGLVSGANISHFEIVPASEMLLDKYQGRLNQIRIK